MDLGGGSPNSHTFVDYKFPTASGFGTQGAVGLLIYYNVNLAARQRPRRAVFPLYHSPSNLSIGKLHKYLIANFPEKGLFDFLIFFCYNKNTKKE